MATRAPCWLWIRFGDHTCQGRPSATREACAIDSVYPKCLPENDYLGDGLTEELTSQLAELQGLRVVARTSAFQFRGKGEDVRRIGQLLNVGAVMEGSVRKSGNRLHVTAQLISTADGYHLWSGTYDEDNSGLDAIQ